MSAMSASAPMTASLPVWLALFVVNRGYPSATGAYDDGAALHKAPGPITAHGVGVGSNADRHCHDQVADR